MATVGFSFLILLSLFSLFGSIPVSAFFKKTKLIYTMANKMQILRLILHKKKLEKYRPDAEGKWVWIPEEEYDGRKYK